MPGRLKALCNTIAYETDEQGCFRWSVLMLTRHRHFVGRRRVSERTVQYGLRELESVGALTVVTAATGRGHTRVYRVHGERFSALLERRYHPLRDPAWPKGIRPKKGATKGCNNGPGKGATFAPIITEAFSRTRTNQRRASQEPAFVRKRDYRLAEIEAASHLTDRQKDLLRKMVCLAG